MSFLTRLYRNHPLANICFAVVLLLGIARYLGLPREQDPEINFNWVTVVTVLPGASAEDVERLVTNPLEDAIKGVADIRFVVSSSRENASSILVRFREISERTFDKRLNDLRREIQNKASAELPREAKEPQILEITTSNGFPTATLLLTGTANDEALRRAGRAVKTDLERMAGVDRVFASGLLEPELQVLADPAKLAARGLTPTDVADSIAAWFRDTSAGTVQAGDTQWLVRVQGQWPDPGVLSRVPVSGLGQPAGVPLDEIAQVRRARAKASQLASIEGRPAISFAVTKKSGVNTLELVERLTTYIAARDALLRPDGLRLQLGDDQTVPTRQAIGVMQNNAWQGLLMVMAVCWLFLGWRVSVLVGLGIPFALAGTFAVLSAVGFTLNVSVLLGVVIVLGMLVDDAVVVVEAIYYRIERGQATLPACVDAVREVWMPVLSSVLTTLAAFLPLMLLPGIVGKFMFVIPFVVSVALLISLIEAFWMLPTHVAAMRLRLDKPSRVQRWRNRFNRGIRLRYGQALVIALRRPWLPLGVAMLLIAGAVGLLAIGTLKVQFFAADPLRIYYVNVDMPPTTSLEQTLAEVERVEREVRRHLRPGESRSVTSLAGLKFTETEPLYGDAYGQVIVALLPREEGGREVGEIIEAMRAPVTALPGPGRKSFLPLSGGPPLTKPISVKVRADDPVQLRAAVDALLAIVRAIPGAKDVVDDDVAGRPEYRLTLDREAMRRAGVSAAQVARGVRMAVDGEVVSVLRHEGDKTEVRVQLDAAVGGDVEGLLRLPLALPPLAGGGVTTLGALTAATPERSKAMIRHYNLRRAITVEADLDKTVLDTPQANARLKEGWAAIQARHPGVDLDFSGELEDIQESLDAMAVLFLFGVGLVYLILAAQFRSYFQPLLILVTVPLAFAGVCYGLVIAGHPLSLFTLYGVIALTGIAVNSAIVLIDAANERRSSGMSIVHATVLASRRRVVPVLITSFTTVAGLASLALGLGGKSLIWGPVAAAIVWGLGVATLLTLFVIPVLYRLFNGRRSPASSSPIGA